MTKTRRSLVLSAEKCIRRVIRSLRGKCPHFYVKNIRIFRIYQNSPFYIIRILAVMLQTQENFSKKLLNITPVYDKL